MPHIIPQKIRRLVFRSPKSPAPEEIQPHKPPARTIETVPEGYTAPIVRAPKGRLRNVFRRARKVHPKPDLLRNPRVVNGYFVSGYATIEIIPAELILLMTKPLAIGDRAALALTSKRMLVKVGRQSLVDLSMNEQARFRFLLQLEREVLSIKDILCYRCKIFHPPESSEPPQDLGETSGHTRPCWEMEAKELRLSHPYRRREYSSPTLPPKLHLNMVRAVLRSYRNGLDFYSPADLSSRMFFTHPNNEAKAMLVATCVVADGDLLLRTVVTLLPSKEKKNARHAAPSLYDIISKEPSLDQICSHFTWRQMFPHVFRGTPSDPPANSFAMRQPMDHKYDDVWNVESVARAKRGRSVKCMWCSTVFNYSWRDLEKTGSRIVSLVSYKFICQGLSVGTGEHFYDRYWVGHMSKPRRPDLKNSYGSFGMYAPAAWIRATKDIPEFDTRRCTLEPRCFEGLDS